MIIDEILKKPRLVQSYYYSINLLITIKSAERLYEQGSKVCIQGFDKIKWEFYPFEIKFKQECESGAELIVFEAEKESEVPIKFRLVTSYRPLKLGVDIIKIEKIQLNLYRTSIDGNLFMFRIFNGEIKEENLSSEDNEILSLVREYGEIPLKDLINIISGKTSSSKDHIRKELFFLKEVGLIEIENGIVSLNKYSRLKR
ncbi:MAG: hypothetical protein L7G92_05395 [Stygiolobus sp.]|jgi:hypothetical protein|nr:hypothetical protein [Stygiolobus sp.]